MTATPSDSREELDKLERKHADNPEGRFFVPLANAYRKNGEIDRAIALLSDGLERHPEYLSAHIVLGRCLSDQGETGAAETEFRYVLSLDPQNLIALKSSGEISLGAGKLDQAKSWYEDLLDVDPMNEDARRALELIDNQSAVGAAAEPDGGDEEEGADAGFGWREPVGVEEEPETRVTSDTAAATSDFEAFLGTLSGSLTDDDDGPAFGNPADAVVTETIAELYTRQGFYDRAIDVYSRADSTTGR